MYITIWWDLNTNILKKGGINIPGLAYSFHLGRDKNRRNSSRSKAKNNTSNSTSLANNGIQNARQLSKVNNHDFRKYDNDLRKVYILKGSNDIVVDVKNFYKREFEEARLEYNNKQSRPSRMIQDYFQYVSDDEKRDLACEIIIELGDKEFWDTKDDEYKKNMVEVYSKNLECLENFIPDFKITDAVVHLDETSPHMHIVGIPIKENCKTGLSKQVNKTFVFTKEKLEKLQYVMRNNCIEEFNNVYDENYSLKEKQRGRNRDINVKDMQDYSELKKELEVKKNSIDKSNDMIKRIKDNSSDFNKILSELEESKFGGYKLNKQQKERLQDLLKELDELTTYFDNYKNIINSLNTINDSLNYQTNKNHELIKEKENLIKDNKKMKEESIDQNDSITFLKAIIKDKNDKQLDLITYLSKNVNDNYGISKSFFKKITEDLRNKGLLSNDEYKVILRPPRVINKSEINRTLSSINREMEDAADEFGNLFQDNEKDDYYL